MGRKLIQGVNDLRTQSPVVFNELSPNNTIDVNMLSVKSNRKVLFICPIGHEYESTPAKRAEGKNCPYCSHHRVLVGYNDLQSQYPEIAAQWHPTRNGDLKPCDFMSASNRKVWWLDEHGHEWLMPVSARTRKDKPQGCPYCSGNRVLIGYNDLATRNPNAAKLWHPTRNGDLEPCDVTYGSARTVWWQCVECGREWRAAVYSVSSGKSGCSHCSHSSVSRMENELADSLCSMLPMYADEIRVNRNKRILIVTDSDGNMIGSRLKEIDILIPSLHVGIEFNGKYWHDDEHIMERVGLSSEEYDKRKIIAADKLGLNLLFVNENDWMNNRKNVLSSLSDYFLV